MARLLADGLDHPTSTDWPTLAKKCLLHLALPKRKVRPRDPRKQERRTTEKECWELVRAIVKQRAGGMCEYCPEVGRPGPPREGNQGCHVLPKGMYKRVRFDTRNVFWGCPDCHKNKWHGFNPHTTESRGGWWEGKIGAREWQDLLARALNRERVKTSLPLVRLSLEAEARRLGIKI